MSQNHSLRNLANTLTSVWVVCRGSIHSQATEAWERAFLSEGTNGPGFNPPQHPDRVVFLGDSLTWEWPLKELFLGTDIRNSGVSGDPLSLMRERWRSHVLTKDAGIVHLLGGTNNILRGYSLGFMQRDVSRMAKLAEVSRMRMILGLLPPMRENRARLNPRIRDFNLWLRIFGEQRGMPVADYYSPLADENGELRASLAQVLPDGRLDQVHLNRAAYEVLTPIAQQAIAQITRRAAAMSS